LVPDGKVGLIAEPNALDIAKRIMDYFAIGADYFIPYLIEEKKKYSWDVMVSKILELSAL
jgi:hypothetical protein